MSQTAVQTRTATPSDRLPVGRIRHSQAPFSQDEFQTFHDVPVFAEHVTKREDGRVLEFGREELSAIARRCNRRIQETGDYAVLTLGHTPDPNDPNGKEPDVVGYAGPYKMGLVGQPGGPHRYAILADFHVFREKAAEVKRHPRRSPELWLADSPEDMFLDPIALLGSQPPRLDMGMLYSASFRGRERLKYTAIAPSAGSVFVPKEEEYGCKEEYEKGFDESNHPRDESGKFGEGGGGKSESQAEASGAVGSPLVGKSWDGPKGKVEVVGWHEQSNKYLVQVPGNPFPRLADSGEVGEMERRDISNAKSQKVSEDKKAAASKSAAEEKAKREGLDGFGDQLPPMAKARLVKSLTANMTLNNKLASRRDHIRRLVADDWKVRTDKKGRRLIEGPSGNFLWEKDITKVGLDYAEHLMANPKSQYSKQIIEGDKSVLDPEEVQQILDALEQLDWVQAAKSQAAVAAGPNATPGLEPQLPMAGAAPGIPPEGMPGEVPGLDPAAGMPGEVPPQDPAAEMPPEGLPSEVPPADETMPPEGAMPQEEELMPDESIAPPVEKEEGFPAEDGPDEAKKKLKDSMDAMSDDDMEEYVRTRKIGRYAIEGTAVGPSPESVASTGTVKPKVEGQIGDGSADEQYQKTEERSAMTEKLGQDGRALKKLEATVDKLHTELDKERGLRVDAERYALLGERHLHHVFDLDKEVERCRYGKMSGEQFTEHLGDIDEHYRPIPIGHKLPLHGRGIDAAAAAATPRGEVDKAKYAKVDSEEAIKMCLESAANGTKLDYNNVLAEVRDKRNGVPAKT